MGKWQDVKITNGEFGNFKTVNGEMAKCDIGKMGEWQNVKMAKWDDGNMCIWQNVNMATW